MTLDEFWTATGIGRWDMRNNDDHLPCFANRYYVNGRVNTPELITAYIDLAKQTCTNDVIVFSVTEKDECWDVWKQYAKDNKSVFKVVQGGSIHGVYLCRLYIYTKPKEERKFHENNIGKYRAR